MKKSLLIFLVFYCCLIAVSQGQMVPQGMKYQAVARNLAGAVLANQPVTLRISLLSRSAATGTLHYSETHTVTTNQLGLFDLTVGGGKATKGAFKDVPWSTEDIWMEIAIQDGSSSTFATVSNSRLLAVPYALHALTASELVGKKTPGPITQSVQAVNAGPSDGVPSNVWSTFGNTRTDPSTDRMGTMDYVDLIFVTNKIERLRITKDGDINIKNSLNVGNNVDIGNDLTVKKSVFLNTTGGSTTVNGPLTVANGSATKLTGTLDVDKATNLNSTLNVVGASTLKSTLDVDGATRLKNTLTVDGATNLNSTLTVNNAAATKLTGVLLVEKDGTFKQKVVLDNASLGSSSPTTGALVVAGGVGIGQNLNVGGNANFGGNTTFGGIVNITDGTESTATTNGALIVAGGVGIGKRLNVSGAVNFSSSLNVFGATTLKNTLGVDGATDLKNTLSAAGATMLNSTLNVAGVTTLNNKLNSNGQVTINADVNGVDSDYNSYPLRVQGSNQGVAIKVDGSRNNSNNFVTFMDDNGIQGRIEGQTTSELEDSQEYKTQVALFVLEGVALAADIVGLGTEAAGLTAAVITIPAAVGVGAQIASATVQAASLLTESITWSEDVHNNVGVAYESGSGDYAEWLERGKSEKDMVFGQIVGVKGGKLSLRTDQADHYMVVSKSPIVLGNMPAAEREKDYEKVAFMGQVPVRIVGKVAIGDYILPSGNHDGHGIAVHPADMKLGDYARIVGVAWQAAKDAPINIINVAVGINTNDLTSKMVSMAQRLDSLNQKTDNILAYLQGKAPLQVSKSVTSVSAATPNNVTAPALVQTHLTKTMSDTDFDRTIDQSAPQLLQLFGEAKNQLTAKGINVDSNPYLTAFFNDPIASVKQLRRDPTMSSQWGRVDQQLQKNTKK